jgi:adenosylhomocysteine nucleosidase
MLAIMSANTEENAAVVAALTDCTTRELGRRLYHVGKLHGTPVVVVFSRWGKVAAAATATQLIASFGARRLVFSGVAGAVAPDLSIGDVVIGAALVQHDMDARPIYARYEIPLLGMASFTTDPALRSGLLSAAQRFLGEDMPAVVDGASRALFGIAAARATAGDIASGDKFFSAAAQVEELRQALPQVACVDMEGAAVAQVCAEYAIPFGIVRTISDAGDHNAVHDFQRFSHDIAGRYSLGILSRFLQSR